MGQHYNVVIKNKNTIIAYNREVDGEKIKEDVLYKLENGKFVEVE